MRVLSISTDRKMFERGSAVRARLLEYGGLAEELHVLVFAKRSLRLRDETISPNIFLYPTNSFGKFFHIPAAIIRALALKRRCVEIDVVTTQDPFEAGVAGYIIARIFNARLHIQIHTDFLSPYFARESLLNRARAIVAKLLIPRANVLRVVSKRIKNSLSRAGCNVSVLPIFVDVAHIVHAQPIEKKFPQFEKIILVAARLSREKNIGSAIEAFASVVKKYPKTGLIIAGDGPELKALVLKVATCQLEPNIIFEGWQNDLVPYYKVADALVLSSYYEGYGMVAVEALVAGCPVIMTDAGCAGDVVRDGENGLVIPVGDTTALAYAMERVVSGKVKLTAKPPRLPTKEEYLAAYKKSWEDAMRKNSNINIKVVLV
ncbi:MAG: glycosyltransferase family 4 protein [Candidatus Yonathbacteria bacterium]|nr:glycosyltransferase family 4 protein [Candidatus Yonathbacteria bacterium]